ncbi:MAG: DNA recombination/repair protein RecA, partial [Alphaproteobacteria bacterium]|nr:DNA recombination/repair protein RecA [Alphaproteobacteria bacterium]
RDHPDAANRIEQAIRSNAGLIADKILEEVDPASADLDE